MFNGLDSVYYDLNGTYTGNAQFVSGNEYSITFTMTSYGNNQITVHAVDASTEHNHSQKTVSIVYYSIPTSITVIAPADNATGIENIGGVSFSWHPATDADGDNISYNIHYGTVSSSMLGELTIDIVIAINNLEGFTQYIWYADVITDHDTIRCPDGDDNFFTFKTKNHDAVITGFNDFSCSINDSVAISISATDAETISEYQWDFNGDGTNDISTSLGAMGYKASATAGNYNFIVKVVDAKGNVTYDTARVSVTNNSPVITNLSDTLFLAYRDSIYLEPTINDDGGNLVCQWDFDNSGFVSVNDGDTAFIPTVNFPMPDTLTYSLRVVDNDDNVTVENMTIIISLKWYYVDNNNLKRDGASICTNGNNLYMMGGDLNNNCVNDVIISSDGLNWTTQTVNAEWSPRRDASAVYFINSVFIVGGTVGMSCLSEVYRSTNDGVGWQQTANLSSFYTEGIYNHGLGVYNDNGMNTMYVIGGEQEIVGVDVSTNRVLRSLNGSNCDTAYVYKT